MKETGLLVLLLTQGGCFRKKGNNGRNDQTASLCTEYGNIDVPDSTFGIGRKTSDFT